MKRYIKPQIDVVVVEAEAMLAASDTIQKTFIPQDTPIESSDDILSKQYSAWGDDEEE